MPDRGRDREGRGGERGRGRSNHPSVTSDPAGGERPVGGRGAGGSRQGQTADGRKNDTGTRERHKWGQEGGTYGSGEGGGHTGITPW